MKQYKNHDQTLIGKHVTLFAATDFKPKIGGKLVAIEQFNFVVDTSTLGRLSVLKHAVGAIAETIKTKPKTA